MHLLILNLPGVSGWSLGSVSLSCQHWQSTEKGGMKLSIEGKVAVITGGGTGIGKSTSLRLSQKGAVVVINYSRSKTEAEETLAEIVSLGGQGLIIQADVAKDHEVRKMMESVAERYGHIDILVNNAGVTDFVAYSDLEGLTDQIWDRAFSVNVKGTFYCCRAAAPYLKKSKGCIINTASIAGVTGIGSSIAYAASKSAIITMTKSLARTLAPEVRVNSISPGIVLTRWVAGQDAHIDRLSKGTPLGRPCNPEDVSEVTLSIIENAGMITGQNIVIDGGMI